MRNESPSRLSAKASKRDIAASRARLLEADKKYRLSSDDDFPLAPHLLIDNSDLSPAEAAARIAQHFDLPSSSR